jgi:hypothetical protein
VGLFLWLARTFAKAERKERAESAA